MDNSFYIYIFLHNSQLTTQRTPHPFPLNSYIMSYSHRLPCLYAGCPVTFKSQHGRTYHIRSIHRSDTELRQQDPSSSAAATTLHQNELYYGDGPSYSSSSGPSGQQRRIEHTYLTTVPGNSPLHQSMINRIAKLEDRVQLAENLARQYATRPDLALSANNIPLLTKTMARVIRMAVTASNSVLEEEEEVELGREDGPADSTTSENGQQDDCIEDVSSIEPVLDISADVSYLGDEEEGETRQRKGKGKGKQIAKMMSRRDTKKKSKFSPSQLRSGVAKARVVKPAMETSESINERKRKLHEDAASPEYHFGPRDSKRSKTDFTGLYSDWEERIETSVPTSTFTAAASRSNCSLDHFRSSRGVSESHEDDDTISQASQYVTRGRQSTWTTTQATVGTENGSKNTNLKRHRGRYSMADMPFSRGSAHTKRWRKVFIPALLSWAGSIEDPFGANGQVEGIIREIWCVAYPDIPLGPKEMDITLGVVNNMLNNWRSDIGKAGCKAVTDLWDDDPSSELSSSLEGRAKFVESALKGFRFIYKHPDVMGSRAAFCSDLITKVYSTHLRRIATSSMNYGPQIGALALVTAAVERGLTVFNDDGKPRGFIDDPWGKKAREWVTATERVDDDRWEQIIEKAQTYFHAGYDVSSSPDAGGPSHAFIELDWCVFFISSLLFLRIANPSRA
ncbi:hypothetical protein B0F90DRAFT_179304 [Multifurca ochricompacta]|uniref:C2H2-type domain-containing protein n=1 Tax=Multifurca ochricompacta TaxID=376703 RepID=A0AAD4M5E9_9AGAM|nr:hypothetical protein B0F90DRAFT_179304 [Multifurca ochricompacta]